MQGDDSAKLFYLVGPSGAGKDSLIEVLRSTLCVDQALLIAHRYITREADSGGENHIALREPEFLQRQQQGLFAMDWQANGYHYALGCEVNSWLHAGQSVLVNGSRQQIDLAKQCFAERLRVIALEVEPERLAVRLRQRGRESESAIQARLARGAYYQQQLPEDCWRLANNSSLMACVNLLQQYIAQQTGGEQ